MAIRKIRTYACPCCGAESLPTGLVFKEGRTYDGDTPYYVILNSFVDGQKVVHDVAFVYQGRFEHVEVDFSKLDAVQVRERFREGRLTELLPEEFVQFEVNGRFGAELRDACTKKGIILGSLINASQVK
jgi:hypothetical protein